MRTGGASGKISPTLPSLATGPIYRTLLWAMAIGLLIMLSGSPGAGAQTLQETWSFIAQDAWVSEPDGMFSPDLSKSRLANCVVTGEYHDPDLPSTIEYYRIDFDQLLANTLRESEHPSDFVIIRMEGDQGAVQIGVLGGSFHVSLDTLLMGFNHWDGIDRKINAFNYFISKFCPGKRSVF